MFEPVIDYIRNLPPQNQVFQYFDQRNQWAMLNLQQLIDNSQNLQTVNVDARQQTINVMLQEVVNILHAQHVPVNSETVNTHCRHLIAKRSQAWHQLNPVVATYNIQTN